MIKSGIKNYFVNLKYFFTPIGTLAVGVVLGISILIPGMLSAISTLAEDLKEIFENAHVSFTPVKDYIVDAVTSLDWNDPVSSLKTMISSDWLKTVLNESGNIISAELEPYARQITEAVNRAIDTFKLLVGVFIFFTVTGLVCGYFLTKFLVRRNMAKRSLWKFFLATFIGAALSAALFIFCLWLIAIWKPSIFLTSLLAFLLFAFESLAEAYAVHGRKKIACKEVLTVKNVFTLLLVNFIVFTVSLVFAFVSVALTNVMAGIFIGFAFVEIAFLVINLNAENYVISLIPKETEWQEVKSAA